MNLYDTRQSSGKMEWDRRNLYRSPDYVSRLSTKRDGYLRASEYRRDETVHYG